MVRTEWVRLTLTLVVALALLGPAAASAESRQPTTCVVVTGRVALDTAIGEGQGSLRAGSARYRFAVTSSANDDGTLSQRVQLGVGPFFDVLETPLFEWPQPNGSTVFLSRADLTDGGEGRLVYVGRVDPAGTARYRMIGRICGWGPDLVLINGAVHTVAAGEETAVAVQGDRIIAVGSDNDVLDSVLAGSTPAVVDLGGRGSIVPGFVDSHSHRIGYSFATATPLTELEDRAFETGVTTIGEPSQELDQIDAIAAAADRDELRLRTRMWPAYNTVCGEVIGDPLNPPYLAFAPSLDPTARFGVPGVKIFSDGGVCEAPAISFEYQSGVDPLPPEIIGSNGNLYLTEDELTAVASDAADAGYQVVIHAIGDVGVETSLGALGSVIGGGPNPLRHRIDHNVLVRPELIGEYVANDVGAVVFGEYFTCRHNAGGWWAQHLDPGDIDWLYPWRDLTDAGVELAWQADFEIYTDDTMLQWWGLVTLGRSEVDPATGDRVFCNAPLELASHGLTTAEALEAMTLNAARQLHVDAEVGSIEVGKSADLVVLSTDPLASPASTLLETEVLATLTRGELVHCALGSPLPCP